MISIWQFDKIGKWEGIIFDIILEHVSTRDVIGSKRDSGKGLKLFSSF
jgi:hypothetical protein